MAQIKAKNTPGMAATVRTHPDFAVESREPLTSLTGVLTSGTPSFYLSPIDRRLIVIQTSVTEDILVQNFFEELRQVVPD